MRTCHCGGMARFFFTRHGARRIEEDEGVDLQDADTARLQAIKFVGASLNDRPYLLSDTRELCVEVRDEQGQFVSLITAFITNDPGCRAERR